MKLNPLTTRKILKGLAVTSGFIAVSGIITSSILGCVAFAQLQNLEIPKSVEEKEPEVIDVPRDPLTILNAYRIQELEGKDRIDDSLFAYKFGQIEKDIKALKEAVLSSASVDGSGVIGQLLKTTEENANQLIDLGKKTTKQIQDLKKQLEDLGNESIINQDKQKSELKDLKDSLQNIIERWEEQKTKFDKLKTDVETVRSLIGLEIQDTWVVKELERLATQLEEQRVRLDELEKQKV